MPPSSPQDESSIRPPHPLAQRLIERLRSRPGSRVLDFFAGSGRNAIALRRAGFDVVAIDDDKAADPQTALASIGGGFAAAVCTHGLLHGAPATIAGRLQSIAEVLDSDGLLYAAFGSTRDARFGRGQRIDSHTFAPDDGDERGVPHAFFNDALLHALLEPHFVAESLEERGVDAVAGSWAHQERPLHRAVHWLVVARRR
jgi:SAM-dependent methyltransferase